MTNDGSKKIALFADIHSNKQALESILAEISEHDYQAVYCLGDLIGCGPNPNECLRLAMESGVKFILGNHDIVALNGKKQTTATSRIVMNISIGYEAN